MLFYEARRSRHVLSKKKLDTKHSVFVSQPKSYQRP